MLAFFQDVVVAKHLVLFRHRIIKDVLRIPLQQAPTSLDPRYGVDARSQIVIRPFEGLTRVGKDGEVHLAAAETVEVRERGEFIYFIYVPAIGLLEMSLKLMTFFTPGKHCSLHQLQAPSRIYFTLLKNAQHF